MAINIITFDSVLVKITNIFPPKNINLIKNILSKPNIIKKTFVFKECN